jgi:hypothetical protein
MHSAVVSFHTNPYTCGVARFNFSLARAMGLPVVQLDTFLRQQNHGVALISIKLEELDSDSRERLIAAVRSRTWAFDLLLHGSDQSGPELELCMGARRVFAATREIAEIFMKHRQDVEAVFAPGAPVLPRVLEVDCTLLTFGMAHKIKSEGYQRLATLMKQDTRSFRLEISTALHEGGSFDEAFFTVGDEISRAFSGNVRFLGFLADAEVSERLQIVDALVAFFPKGARENNTTVLSAMSHGCPVITNLDANSPSWMEHAVTVFDVGRLKQFPTSTELRQVGWAAKRVAGEFTFERLATEIADRAQPE